MALRALGVRLVQPVQAASSDHALSTRHRLCAVPVRAETTQSSSSVAAAVMARQALQLKAASAVIPHPAKAHYGGEDAHFLITLGGGAIGVADGVGGWNDSGISPAEYSRTFMETARKFLEGELDEEGSPSDVASTSDWMDARQGWDGAASTSGEASTDSDAAAAAAGRNGASSAAASTSAPTPLAPSNGAAANGAAVNGAAVNGAVKSAFAKGGTAEADAEAAAAAVAAAAAERARQEEEARRKRAEAERRRRALSRTPLQALDIAHRLTRLPGSATACILRLDGERGVLNAANVGDSGFLLLRGGKLLFQSPALQHFFDCPYQFGAHPEYAEATDSIEDADVFDFEVQPGDVVVLATDGLLDNCYTEEIVALAPSSAEGVQQAAAALAELASQHANDPDFESPYTEEAAQEGFDIPIWEKLFNASIKDGKLQLGKLRGGKLDDVTVLVAYVEAVPDSP